MYCVLFEMAMPIRDDADIEEIEAHGGDATY